MEWYREGRVPLHTLRADIDYGVATAKTTYGTCGVKVWIFKGEIMEHDPMAQEKRLAEADRARRIVRAASRASATASTRERGSAMKVKIMLQPKRTKFRKAFKGRIHGAAKGGHDAQLRRLRPEGDRAGARHRAPDRGRAPRDHAPDEARGPRLDPRVPGRAGVEEAGRSAHGQGQGRAGILGRARRSRAASCSRSTACREKLAREAFALAAAKLPIKTRFVQRIARLRTQRHEERQPPSDLRGKTEDELERQPLKLKKEQFNLRFQRATGQLENTARVRVVRRDIARIKTVAAQKQRRQGRRLRKKHMPKRILQGVVVSDKKDKTVVVKVERRFTHPVLKKTVRRSKKYHAHDENKTHKVGDMVSHQERGRFPS